MKQEEEKVFVGILANGAMVHGTQALLAFQLPIWSFNPEVPYSFAFWIEADVSPQDYKRNVIIEKFLESKCDTLVMIDDDMIINQTFLDLLGTPDYDIAGPLQYTMKAADPEKDRLTPECFPCAFMIDHEGTGQMKPVWPASNGPVAEVDLVGSGVIAIKRRVFEDVRMLHEDGHSPPAYFRNIWLPNGRRECGLDIDFCRRAKALGYKIKVNWQAEVGHFKQINLNDVDMFAKAQFLKGYGAGEKSHEVQVEQ